LQDVWHLAETDVLIVIMVLICECSGYAKAKKVAVVGAGVRYWFTLNFYNFGSIGGLTWAMQAGNPRCQFFFGGEFG